MRDRLRAAAVLWATRPRDLYLGRMPFKPDYEPAPSRTGVVLVFTLSLAPLVAALAWVFF